MSGQGGLTKESEALLAELGESPLSGARYARAVVARDLAKIEAAAAREALPSVEEMARALIRVTPPERHGQLCPAWVGREGSPDPVTVCDCWVKGNAPKRAYALVGQLAAARASDGGR